MNEFNLRFAKKKTLSCKACSRKMVPWYSAVSNTGKRFDKCHRGAMGRPYSHKFHLLHENEASSRSSYAWASISISFFPANFQRIQNCYNLRRRERERGKFSEIAVQVEKIRKVKRAVRKPKIDRFPNESGSRKWAVLGMVRKRNWENWNLVFVAKKQVEWSWRTSKWWIEKVTDIDTRA